MPLCEEILVIEDNKDSRDLLTEALQAWGYKVASASNGAEGLEMLHAAAGSTLVLLDLMMPVMSGWDFLRHEGCQHHRIITISAVHPETTDFSDVWTGIDEHLSKPVALQELARIVKFYCGPMKTGERAYEYQ